MSFLSGFMLTRRVAIYPLMLFLSGSVASIFSSCSIEKHMTEKTNELIQDMEKIPDWEQLPAQQMSWNEAVSLAMKNNLDLRRAEETVVDAERSVNRIFLDMIPGVNLDAMITKDLDGLKRISTGDVSYHTNLLFNFPSLTKVPIQYYTAKAGVYRGKKTLEMKKREIASRLYKAAREYSLSQEMYQLQLSQIPYYDDGRERKRVQDEWKEKSKRLSSEISMLVGGMDKRRTIIPSTLPRLDWGRYKQACRQLDFLVMTMMAMEIEASRLNMLGVKMQYFPELNVNFYSPSLFSSTAGTYSGIYASSSDVQVNMNLSWRLDTQLRVWYQLKSAQAQHRFLLEEIRMRVIERKEKVRSLVKSREDYEEWSGYTRKRMEFLTKRVPTGSEDYRNTRTEITDLTKELYGQGSQNVEVEASLILEYGFL